jgi:protein TonB
MPRLFTLVSVTVHAVVIVGVLIAQVLDIGALPLPRQFIAFSPDQIVKTTNVPLDVPKPSPRVRTAAQLNADAAPIEAPNGVAPEVERPAAAAVGVNAGLVEGIEGGGGFAPGLVFGNSAPPAPPPPVNIRAIPLHKGIQAPRKVVDVAPRYPVHARAARQQGVVILETIIDVDGNVTTVRVLRGYPLLDESAVEAVRQWRFTPALLNGQPIPVVMTVTVNFALR